MKLSTIATSTFLLVASAAADNNSKTAGNLKKRLLEDPMSMPATEEASDPDKQHWWHNPDPTPGCNGTPTTTCEGFEYLKLVTGAELGLTPFPDASGDPGDLEIHIAWTKFFEATPAGCVLAPIDTEEDLLKAQAAVAPRQINAWVGLFKEAADVCGGALLGACPFGDEANANDWKNLDGTPSSVANLAVPNDIWRDGEPNNKAGDGKVGVQQYVHLFYNEHYRLRDENDQGSAVLRADAAVPAAVYKCCSSAPVLTFPDCP